MSTYNLLSPYQFASTSQAVKEIMEVVDIIFKEEKKNILLVSSAKKTYPIVLRNMVSSTFATFWADVVICGIDRKVLKKVYNILTNRDDGGMTLYYSSDGQILSIRKLSDYIKEAKTNA